MKGGRFATTACSRNRPYRSTSRQRTAALGAPPRLTAAVPVPWCGQPAVAGLLLARQTPPPLHRATAGASYSLEF